ncbi:MAG: hypothetical protein BTN85_0827 [Candidatus Methanohalarchaeum thermophilum]|uniref:Twin-arginine translocation signal domain-containing protein n=1 Tax=Methanohalarchaeum thermophilum TaxID=1903181 RepID=A0A1Q6DVH1_METT1|nr:MAG: hypothetical protein BTN85_0827 [Candidatus Methanohalarchaeum thermophilum]
MERRSFLKGLSVFGLAAAAGAGGLLVYSNRALGQVPAPSVDLKEGWEKIDEKTGTVFERDFGVIKVKANQHLVQYEDQAIREKIRKGTLGAVDTPIALFFASKINTNINLEQIPLIKNEVISQAKKQAKNSLLDRLKEYGIKEIKKTKSRDLDLEINKKINLSVFKGYYPIEKVKFDLKDKDLNFSGSKLKMTAYLGAWTYNGYILIAGGVHPSQDYEKTYNKEITDLINMTLKLDLGLKPNKTKNEILSQIQSTT